MICAAASHPLRPASAPAASVSFTSNAARRAVRSLSSRSSAATGFSAFRFNRATINLLASPGCQVQTSFRAKAIALEAGVGSPLLPLSSPPLSEEDEAEGLGDEEEDGSSDEVGEPDGDAVT